MELKKSPKADLENKKSMYVLIGLVLALSFMYVCFEWTQTEAQKIEVEVDATAEVEEEIVQATVQQNTPPPPPPPPPAAVVNEVIDIVKNDEVVETKVDIKEADIDAKIEIPQQVNIQQQEEETVDEIFTVVEEMPSFPGGTKELMKFLSKNIKYPEIAAENGIKGRVMVSFVVNKDGKIVDVTVLRGVDPSLDKEAVRVVKSMPAWKPGMQSGKPVRTRYTLPVMFKLQ